MRTALLAVMAATATLATSAIGARRAAATPKYHGARIDLDFDQAPVRDLLLVIGDVAHSNVVMSESVTARADIHVKNEPWDQVLDELLAGSKLAMRREGSVFRIGTPAEIAALPTARPTYRGRVIDLDVKDAELGSALALLAAAGEQLAIDGELGSPRAITLRLRRVPSDQAVELLLWTHQLAMTRDPKSRTTHLSPADGATRFAAPRAVANAAVITEKDCEKRILAPELEHSDLRFDGVLRVDLKRVASFHDAARHVFVAHVGDCITRQRAHIKEIGDAFVTFALSDGEWSARLHPVPAE